MVTPQQNPYRQAIVQRIKDPGIRAEWDSLGKKSEAHREDRVESTLNRVKPFVQHEVIRRIIGQQKNTINFHDVLAKDKIVLVNLARQNVISDDDRHLLGTLLVNELLTAAFARPKAERNPFYLFIDEFEHFVTKDICEVLDGGRKFGLHLVLAHQYLGQLKEKDPEVYYSALANARTKVVFGGMIDEDLDVMAKELYTGELNPDEIKNEIWQTKFSPVESSRVVVSESESTAESLSTSEVTHASLSQSSVFIDGSTAWSENPNSVMIGEGSASASSSGVSQSSASGRTTTEVPFYEMHEFKELSSVTFRSLEEQIYKKKAQMKRQGTQHAAVLVPGKNVELIKTPTVQEFEVEPAMLDAFKEACFSSAGYFSSPEEADREVRRLEEGLLVGEAVRDSAEEVKLTVRPLTDNDEEFFGR